MEQYHLTVRHELLYTRVALKHLNRIRVVNLLLDSGSTYTIVSRGVLLSLKLEPATSSIRRSVMTANGSLVLPEVAIDELHALGQRIERFPVLAHTVPLGSQVDGLLGMSFLRRFETALNFKQATIWL